MKDPVPDVAVLLGQGDDDRVEVPGAGEVDSVQMDQMAVCPVNDLACKDKI